MITTDLPPRDEWPAWDSRIAALRGAMRWRPTDEPDPFEAREVGEMP